MSTELTHNEIIRMAREAGMEVHERKGQIRIGSAVLIGCDSTEQVTRFAAFVAAAARALQDARHAEELAAYELTVSNLRAEKGAPGGWVMVSTDTLYGWKTQVNTLAVLSGQDRRERTIELKQEIADILAAPQPPAQAVDCDKFSEAEITWRGGIDDDTRQQVREAVADALGDAYDCMRVWSAWQVGTMSQLDFCLVSEDDDRVAEIADAAMNAMLAAAPQPAAQAEVDRQSAIDYDASYGEHLAQLDGLPNPTMCNSCDGSGEAEYITTHLGPEDYSVAGQCMTCGGSGVAAPQPAAQSERKPTSVSLSKRAQLEADGYVVNGVAMMHPETRRRVLLDYCGFVGWYGPIQEVAP